MLLGEIENHIRRILAAKFTPEELADARDPSDAERSVNEVADLTFGEYIRLLENPDHWTKLDLPIDRKTLIKELNRVREIRNDVMHFDPDPMPADDLNCLRELVEFLSAVTTNRCNVTTEERRAKKETFLFGRALVIGRGSAAEVPRREQLGILRPTLAAAVCDAKQGSSAIENKNVLFSSFVFQWYNHSMPRIREAAASLIGDSTGGRQNEHARDQENEQN